jgi:hypothetical protein
MAWNTDEKMEERNRKIRAKSQISGGRLKKESPALVHL